MKPTVFTASQFTSTQWDTAEDKAKFANHFVRFIKTGFSDTLFYKEFYRRLSMCRGHIAHFNTRGFYDEWCSSLRRRLDFLNRWAWSETWGDPAFTYADVERALAQWIRESGLLKTYADLVEREATDRDMAELARLKAKYPNK